MKRFRGSSVYTIEGRISTLILDDGGVKDEQSTSAASDCVLRDAISNRDCAHSQCISCPGSALPGTGRPTKRRRGQVFTFAFDFKTNGDVLSGTVGITSQTRTFEIKQGKIKGNSISFVGFGIWTGTLNGDELQPDA